MKGKLKIITIGCFVLNITNANADPGISSINMIDENQGTINISGADFGDRADNSSNTYMPMLWDDFENGNFNNWSFRVGGDSWEISGDHRRARSDSDMSIRSLSRTSQIVRIRIRA